MLVGDSFGGLRQEIQRLKALNMATKSRPSPAFEQG